MLVVSGANAKLAPKYLFVSHGEAHDAVTVESPQDKRVGMSPLETFRRTSQSD
jgi:hypothetical protein